MIIIAEVGQNHDGSLGQAHAFIDAIAKTGADVVKFQTHIAEAESTPGEPFRVPFSYEDANRYDYWKRMEFTKDQWAGLKRHAEEKGLVFMSSPFSDQAVILLQEIGITAWKVGSGEVNSWRMIEKIARTQKPVYFSTGMSSYAEIDELVAYARKLGMSFTLMQCTSNYPCTAENVGLNVLAQFRERYGCPVGLSDHSGLIYPALAAAALGASALEVHVTMSREMFGPDVSSSITTEELKRLAEGVRFIKDALAHPVDKDAQAKELEPLKKIFSRSALASTDLPKGSRISERYVVFKKQGSGLTEKDILKLEGRKTARLIKKGEPIKAEDLIS